MCVGNIILTILLLGAVFWWVIYVTVSMMAIKELQEDYRLTRKDYWDLRTEVVRLKNERNQRKGKRND